MIRNFIFVQNPLKFFIRNTEIDVLCGPPRLSLSTLINKNNQVLISGELCHKTGIQDRIKEFFKEPSIESSNFKHMVYSVSWVEGNDSTFLWSIIEQLLVGHLAEAERFATKKFNKNLCNLNPSELESVKENRPFVLGLSFGLGFTEPLPPPPESPKF